MGLSDRIAGGRGLYRSTARRRSYPAAVYRRGRGNARRLSLPRATAVVGVLAILVLMGSAGCATTGGTGGSVETDRDGASSTGVVEQQPPRDGDSSRGGQPRDAATIEAEAAKEQEVGQAAFAKLDGQYGVVTDTAATAYLNKYLQSLSLFVERQEIPYRAAILNTSEINAYALPGGYIFVTLGTLQQVQTPGELAGILAHELGHVQHRHVLDQVTIEVGYDFAETLARFLAGGRQVVNTAMAQVNDAIEERLFLEGYQADDEYEADRFALEFLHSLGISAQDYVSFLTRLGEHQVEADASLDNLDATHPPLDERLKRLRPMVNPDLPPLEPTDQFNQFRSTIQRLSRQGAAADQASAEESL